jgi:glycosyltransferase involved in cell wall biosynthesis
MTPWLIPAVLSLGAWLAPYIDFRLSRWKIRYVEEIAPSPAPLPRLSVVVPALNEEATVEPAMRSLLALDYPDLEVIAVDDRSTDSTGEILDRLAKTDSQLQVVHVRDLPAGWLGKNHALHLGAERATGEFILFTDADVHFEPTALSRAVGFAADNQLDHLVILPRVVLHGFWETACVWFFGVIFTLKFRPWRVSDPKRKDYIGVGAFNLVRKGAYRRAGGHASLPMDIGDDIKLGKVMKRAGGRADVLMSDSMVRVRWVNGVRGLIQGLTKNMFAGLEFSPVKLVVSSLGLLLLAVWPFAGLFFGPLAARAICAATVLVILVSSAQGRPYRGASPLYAFAFPAAALVVIYIFYRSAWFTYRNDGIVWRGTRYPLSELRKGIV